MPKHGETRNIKIVIDGVGYDAQLKNQGFDRNKYDGHADVIQIRYSEGSDIVKRLRKVFASTWNYVESIKNLPENINRKFTIRTEFFPSYLSITDKYWKAFQLLWFLSSFVASCKDGDVKPIVYCKS